MKLPHPIPYQGSKRNLAEQILQMFPKNFNRLIEPFAGSAAITIAAASKFKGKQFIINDINTPLANLWREIINNPDAIVKSYHDTWHGQLDNQDQHYYNIRTKFNETQQPDYLLFLLAKCVKAAVRYNAQGEFNQSPDKRRLGKKPESMQSDLLRVSKLLRGRTTVYSSDYQDVLNMANADDLVYMDPPYQGTGQNGGFKYAGTIEFDSFMNALNLLNDNNVPYILSYDGRTGDKTYGSPIPESLNLTKIEINAGRSSQATLLSREEYTFEAVYLSPALTAKLASNQAPVNEALQSELFAH
ncbi:Dam family site-specific DNA-(adenine-N6)-methyltransferase [Hymenobacter sp. AT01-02]|uniref:Dam family site-specific DNA-(adenine-N6)-methyltransferase n=1 Tax=Hymenobacter sp. AT01-02 TaxID=1571877 RepID=UPI0005F22101|nr:DNA adenine methylase [Hymenobacter sp. AT01-02]